MSCPCNPCPGQERDRVADRGRRVGAPRRLAVAAAAEEDLTGLAGPARLHLPPADYISFTRPGTDRCTVNPTPATLNAAKASGVVTDGFALPIPVQILTETMDAFESTVPAVVRCGLPEVVLLACGSLASAGVGTCCLAVSTGMTVTGALASGACCVVL